MNNLPNITAQLLERYDVPGPRYTSYPTADRFSDFDEASYIAALKKRQPHAPLSIYVHIPFCKRLCYYCACNKIITHNYDRGTQYLSYLQREIDLHISHMGGAGQSISQLHLGGGSPTFLNDADLSTLMAMLRRAFSLAPDGEYSIEVDPRTVDAQRLRHIRELGFNRLSLGIQDFDLNVQRAVHRIQPAEDVFALVKEARNLGFASINADLIYGLPRQTEASFARTLEQVGQLRPDRIALYAYAHLPARFTPQRHIDAYHLPGGGEKIAMLAQALQNLREQEYVYVGMDHFALPGDALAIAKEQGKLHRNFQGYSTLPDCDLIGLGLSSISRMGNIYSQNAKSLPAYIETLDAGHLPVARGLQLSQDDLLRRDVIMAIMCQGRVGFESISAAHGIDFSTYFAQELTDLDALRMQGMLNMDKTAIELTEQGWYFVRAIAMVFDRYLRNGLSQTRFSKII